MADPKYANLPGIDANSPDVFESNDLPEAEQNLTPAEPEELSSESVERISISTDTAFKTFKGKSVATGNTDFSSGIGKSSTITYVTDKTKLLEDGVRQETPHQKFQRLQHEIQQLTDEVKKVKEHVPATDSGESILPEKQLEHLQNHFADLHLEKLLGSEALIDLANPQETLKKRLLTQLESLKTGIDETSKATEDASKSGHILYELYYKPEQAQFSRNTRIATLEERLERLENVIGKNFDKMNTLTTDAENKSLIGAVAALSSKLSLLDAVNTETVEARLNVVLQKMQHVSEKKTETPVDTDNQTKISDLYDLVKKWETTVETLPQIVDRLLSLKELHEQALQFSQVLLYLDTAQQEVQVTVVSHGDMLKQLQSSLTENSKIIQQNVQSLEKRLKALEKS
uniref:Dynactin subunit 2 n=1 Tax=Arion vulgaris TaxID=1028688 RepID=A0A0B7AB77_9EUPU